MTYATAGHVQALNAAGLAANALGFGIVVISILRHASVNDAILILVAFTAIPYAVMVLVHLYLCRFASQRITAFLASLIVSAIGIWLSIPYLKLPVGETSPGMGFGWVLIVIYAGAVALAALAICAIIQRVVWLNSQPRAHVGTDTAKNSEHVV